MAEFLTRRFPQLADDPRRGPADDGIPAGSEEEAARRREKPGAALDAVVTAKVLEVDRQKKIQDILEADERMDEDA